MKKPKKADFKNCKDPEFAYIYAKGIYDAWVSCKKNPFLKLKNTRVERKDE